MSLTTGCSGRRPAAAESERYALNWPRFARRSLPAVCLAGEADFPAERECDPGLEPGQVRYNQGGAKYRTLRAS